MIVLSASDIFDVVVEEFGGICIDSGLLVNHRYIYGLTLSEILFFSYRSGYDLDIDNVEVIINKINRRSDGDSIRNELILRVMSYMCTATSDTLFNNGFANGNNIVSIGYFNNDVYFEEQVRR